MNRIIAILVLVILIMALGFFIGQSCTEKQVIVNTDANLKEQIQQINESIADIKDSITVLAQQRIHKVNYYNYEIIKMDSVYPNSTIAYWDSVILAWADIIYGLPGFFDIRINQDSTLQSSKDSSTSSKLLRTDKEFERRE